MKRINKQLIESFTYIKGTVLGIGLDDEINEEIKKRDNIGNFYIIDRNKKKSNNEDNDNQEDDFNICKLYKKFNNKDIDYTICNMDILDKYTPYFIRDIININDEKIYIYGSNNNLDINMLYKQLKRYHTKIEKIDCGEYFLIILDTKDIIIKTSTKYCYFLKDMLFVYIDKIGNILVK